MKFLIRVRLIVPIVINWKGVKMDDENEEQLDSDNEQDFHNLHKI